MPRAPLGDAARTEVVTVRVTPQEKKVLTALYGKPAIGIYAWIKSVTRKAVQ